MVDRQFAEVDVRRMLHHSRGSRDLKMLPNPNYERLEAGTTEVKRMLTSLAKKLVNEKS